MQAKHRLSILHTENNLGTANNWPAKTTTTISERRRSIVQTMSIFGMNRMRYDSLLSVAFIRSELRSYFVIFIFSNLILFDIFLHYHQMRSRVPNHHWKISAKNNNNSLYDLRTLNESFLCQCSRKNFLTMKFKLNVWFIAKSQERARSYLHRNANFTIESYLN